MRNFLHRRDLVHFLEPPCHLRVLLVVEAPVCQVRHLVVEKEVRYRQLFSCYEFGPPQPQNLV